MDQLENKDALSGVRPLTMAAEPTEDTPLWQVIEGLVMLPKLEDLRWTVWPFELVWEWLGKQHPVLRSLHLAKVSLPYGPRFFLFPALVSLALVGVDSVDQYTPRLTPDTVPSLRAMSYCVNWQRPDTRAEDFPTELDPGLLQQLDALQFDGFDCTLFDTAAVDNLPASSCVVTDTTSGFWLNSPNPPLCIHLPLFAPLPPDETLSDAVKSLEDACSAKCVALVRFDLEGEEEHAVSPSFWRYAKERKAMKATKGQ
ncbi:hypothetical protein JCM8547_006095 [Rhodosporidiobolus lusitaniae]